MTLSVLKRTLGSLTKAGLLLDGFPRSLEQAVAFAEQIGAPRAALYFDCSEETMLERLRHRAETSGRADDTEEIIVKRLATFRETTIPVVEYLRSQENLLLQIDASAGIEDVAQSAAASLQSAGIEAK